MFDDVLTELDGQSHETKVKCATYKYASINESKS